MRQSFTVDEARHHSTVCKTPRVTASTDLGDANQLITEPRLKTNFHNWWNIQTNSRELMAAKATLVEKEKQQRKAHLLLSSRLVTECFFFFLFFSSCFFFLREGIKLFSFCNNALARSGSALRIFKHARKICSIFVMAFGFYPGMKKTFSLPLCFFSVFFSVCLNQSYLTARSNF